MCIRDRHYVCLSVFPSRLSLVTQRTAYTCEQICFHVKLKDRYLAKDAVCRRRGRNAPWYTGQQMGMILRLKGRHTTYVSAIVASVLKYLCKKTSQFKTQCKGDISRAFKTAKITVFDITMCKKPDVPLQAELLALTIQLRTSQPSILAVLDGNGWEY